MREEHGQPIEELLRGKTLLLTGASGFVGKAVLATCLSRLDGLHEIRLLLRAADDAGAERRLREDVVPSLVFAPGEETDVEEALRSGRLRAEAADLAAEGLGRATPLDLSGVDVVVHCAASVSFEEPLDAMLELNALGTARLADAVTASGADPSFVHVSTAYVAGMRTGLVLERPSGGGPGEPAVDLHAELDAARTWRRDLEADSRLPVHQHRFVADAREEIGPAGAPAVGARAETARRKWVEAQLRERGRERCRALGWADAYAFSKALGERALIERGLRRLTIVRPSIIESALRWPHPGWLEGLKVTDPVILGYGRGLIPRFPGNAAVRFDLVPVDFVAGACLTAAAHPPEDGPRVIHVASGSRRPLELGRVVRTVGEYFRERPFPDEEGVAVDVDELPLVPFSRASRAIDRGERVVRLGRRIVDRLPVPRADEVERRLHRERRSLERLRRLSDMYGPYGELDCVFDDRHAVELLGTLHPEDRERFGFDALDLDWDEYLRDIHLPALRALVGVPRVGVRPVAADREAPGSVLPEGPPGLAFFDLEGVVLDTTVAHFYAWLRTRDMPRGDRALWSLGLAARAPGYIVADRRSRAAFNRSFYRNYRGLPAAELREQAEEALSEFILPRMHQEAVRRIRAHRRRGDRVVLLTGALDFLVAPLRHLGDDLVAARLTESRGAFTGELAEPPLTADGRASLAARMAAEHGADLTDCHAYGDSASDLPMLELVGHAHAVNPDFRLSREARRRGWPVLEWTTEAGARSRPAVAAGA
jgi:fatty acyl-CoA reductase